MRRLIIFFFLFHSTYSFSQAEKDTLNLSIAFSSYLLPKNTIYPNGCIAIGPSLFLNDSKISLQLGILYDLKAYYIYEGGHPLPNRYQKIKTLHILLPILIHYKFHTINKFDFILSGGIILEGRPETIDVQGYTNFTIGSGIKYRLLKKLNLKASPTLQFSSGDIFPALLLDLIYSFDIIRRKALQ